MFNWSREVYLFINLGVELEGIGQGGGLRLGGRISREPAALHGTLLTICTTPLLETTSYLLETILQLYLYTPVSYELGIDNL